MVGSKPFVQSGGGFRKPLSMGRNQAAGMPGRPPTHHRPGKHWVGRPTAGRQNYSRPGSNTGSHGKGAQKDDATYQALMSGLHQMAGKGEVT